MLEKRAKSGYARPTPTVRLRISTMPKISILVSIGVILALSFALLPIHLAIVSIILGGLMLAIAIHDYRTFVIPDVYSLPAIPAGLLFALLLKEQSYTPELALFHSLSALACGTLLWGLRIAYRLYRNREGLGLGDVKLAFACGAWVGFPGFAHVLLLAALVAIAHILYSNMKNVQSLSATTKIPFGAYFAPAIWSVWFVQMALNKPPIDVYGAIY